MYVEVGSIVVPGCGPIPGCDTRGMHPWCLVFQGLGWKCRTLIVHIL